jgi:broad specificity phosphatase PhoE
MGKLILVRHGESHANRHRIFAEDHTPLTDLGRKQALEVASRIASRFRPVAVVSSPLARAHQTAEIISRELGLAVEIVLGLEESDFGFLKGQSYEVYHRHIQQDPTFDKNAMWRWVPEGGESTEQAGRRVVPVLEQLAARHPEDEILVVCHGMLMVAIWAQLAGTWHGFDVPPNCAVLVMDHSAGKLTSPVLIEECLVAQE